MKGIKFPASGGPEGQVGSQLKSFDYLIIVLVLAAPPSLPPAFLSPVELQACMSIAHVLRADLCFWMCALGCCMKSW